MTEDIRRMAEKAMSRADEAWQLGHKNSSAIAVVRKDLEGHKETCEAQNVATHEKLDLIIRVLTWAVKGGVSVAVSVIGYLIAKQWGAL